MKKLMIAAGAALCAAVGFSDVTSANCVGYLSKTPGAVSGTMEFGISFNNLGEEDGGFVIKDKIFSIDAEDGDAMLIFNPNAYNYDWYQYMWNDDGTGMIWKRTDYSIGEDFNLDSFTVNDGDSVVIYPTWRESIDLGTFNIAISGEVADLKGASRTFVINFNSDDFNYWYMPISNPYPIATTKKMLDGFAIDGDALMIWNDAGYNYDWCQYTWNDAGDAMIWKITDSLTGLDTNLTEDDDIVLEAGRGAVFVPCWEDHEGEFTRVWTVNLAK